MVVAFAVGATLIAAGARPRDLGLIALALGFVALLVTLVEPYRMARLTGFLNPAADTSGTGFQAAQAKIAIGSGGIFGVGIGNGVQKAYYLPEAHTDMIAAVIGEELGLLGMLGDRRPLRRCSATPGCGSPSGPRTTTASCWSPVSPR